MERWGVNCLRMRGLQAKRHLRFTAQPGSGLDPSRPQNFVTSVKLKSWIFMAGTTMSNDSSPPERIGTLMASTFESMWRRLWLNRKLRTPGNQGRKVTEVMERWGVNCLRMRGLQAKRHLRFTAQPGSGLDPSRPQNFVTSVKLKSWIFMAGTTMSND